MLTNKYFHDTFVKIHKEEKTGIHSFTAEDNIQNLGERQSIVIIVRFRVFFIEF